MDSFSLRDLDARTAERQLMGLFMVDRYTYRHYSILPRVTFQAICLDGEGKLVQSTDHIHPGNTGNQNRSLWSVTMPAPRCPRVQKLGFQLNALPSHVERIIFFTHLENAQETDWRFNHVQFLQLNFISLSESLGTKKTIMFNAIPNADFVPTIQLAVIERQNGTWQVTVDPVAIDQSMLENAKNFKPS